MKRRALCMLILTALLTGLMPGGALAISGQEALFGGPVSDSGDSSQGAYGGPGDGSGTYPLLKPGDRDGEDSAAYIVFMQNRLIQLGYLRNSADGVYGEDTRLAVLNFQKNNNLPETGVADSETQRKLYSDPSTLVAAMTDDSAFGGEITRVQNVLGMWGFYGGKVDGLTGETTEDAICTFKRYIRTQVDPGFGVTPTPEPTATPNPDGRFADMPTVVDELIPLPTSDPLTDASITPALMDYVNGAKSIPLYRATIANGASGDEALRVQTRLRQLKYVFKADGVFGEVSELGLKYFQRKNGLPETGIADEATQKLLFSINALEAEEYVFPYKLVVDVSDQRVYVMQWSGSSYGGPLYTFKCATGKKDTPTPLGTYQANGKTGNEWYFFKDYNCYAKWAYHIVGGVLFHSNTTSKPKGNPGDGGLGYRASHGCIRLAVEDAKWIYFNCPEGTTVVVQE